MRLQPSVAARQGGVGRTAVVVGTAVLLGAGALAYDRSASAARARAHGEALFHGTAALPGRLAGHDAPLPPVATSCRNCHEAGSVAPGRARAADTVGGAASIVPNTVADPAARRYASRLDRVSLETVRSRHGGPPSRFDAPRLCRLLRTGVDPAQVLIPPTMPRYPATDAQCADLWAYLRTR